MASGGGEGTAEREAGKGSTVGDLGLEMVFWISIPFDRRDGSFFGVYKRMYICHVVMIVTQ